MDKKDSASIIRMVIKPPAGEKLYIVHDLYPNGKSKLLTHSIKPNGNGFEGYSLEFYPTGVKKSDEIYRNNELTGPVTSYYPTGKLYLTGTYTNGILIINQCRDTLGNILATDGTGEAVVYDEGYTKILYRGHVARGLKTGKWLYFEGNNLKFALIYDNGNMQSGIGYDSVGKEHPFRQISEEPLFKNGRQSLYEFIKNKVSYLKEAKNAGIRGTVHVAFTIEVNGKLTNVHVTGGLGHGLDEEAVRVINLTSLLWLPAKQFGMPVKTEQNVPINFGLNTANSSYKLSQQ